MRDALRRHDSTLNVWWSPSRGHQTGLPGRWRVVRWRRGTGEHQTLFYWEGPQKQYRPLAVQPILHQLRQDEHNARSGVNQDTLDEQAEMVERRKTRRYRMMLMEGVRERADAERKQVFAPGYVRPRNFGEVRLDMGRALVDPSYYRLLSDFHKAVVDHEREKYRQ